MKRKIALILSAVLAVGAFAGCGSKGQLYEAEDGSFSITLPNENWEVASEDAENGMYVFSLPVTSDSAISADSGLESEAIMLYFNLSEEMGNLGYDTIPTTEQDLTDSLGEDLDYELISFEGGESDDGVKSNLYKIKFTDEASGFDGYIISKTEADEENGYIIAGEVLSGSEEVFEDIEKSIESLKKNEVAKADDADEAEEETEAAKE